MRWLSGTCVVLRCDELISSSYSLFQTIPHQFSVQKPYQAPSLLQPKNSSEGNHSNLETPAAVCTRAHRSAAPVPAPPEPVLEESNTRPNKRRRKGHSDAQAQSRQAEAQQRHDIRKPSLLSAYQLFQHFLQEADSSSMALHTYHSTDAPLVSCCHAVEDSSMQQTDSLDLIALQELKYTLRPKFSVVAEGMRGTPVNLFDNLISNDGDQEEVADVFGHAVLIPAHAAFLLSDIKKLNPLLTGLQYIKSHALLQFECHCTLRTMSSQQHHHTAVHDKSCLHDSLHDHGKMSKMQARQT